MCLELDHSDRNECGTQLDLEQQWRLSSWRFSSRRVWSSSSFAAPLRGQAYPCVGSPTCSTGDARLQFLFARADEMPACGPCWNFGATWTCLSNSPSVPSRCVVAREEVKCGPIPSRQGPGVPVLVDKYPSRRGGRADSPPLFAPLPRAAASPVASVSATWVAAEV